MDAMTGTGPTALLASSYSDSFRGSPSRSALLNPCGKSARPTRRDIVVAFPISNAGHPLDNTLLASLPRDHFDLLFPHLSIVCPAQGTALVEAGDDADQVYFAHAGMLSLLAVQRDGKAIDTA